MGPKEIIDRIVAMPSREPGVAAVALRSTIRKGTPYRASARRPFGAGTDPVQAGESEGGGGGESVRRRALCNGVLAAVAELRRRGVTVLAGVVDAPLPGMPDWKVTVVSLTPRLPDPGAAKRRTVLVDDRCLLPGPGYAENLARAN